MTDVVGGDKQRVLILDDDTLVGKALLTHVKAIGHEGRFTDDPHEFLDLTRTWKPSRVIVDLVMDTMDGLEVLQRLADDGCEAGVIISSGTGKRVMDAARRLADAQGLVIAGLLPKPYKRADLSALLLEPHKPAVSRAALGTAVASWWTPEEFSEVFGYALDSGHITVAYQPKVSCRELKVVGYEALARWTDPDHGSIPPSEFVPMAEAAGMVGRVTHAVLSQALGWFGAQSSRGGLMLSINISAAELAEPELDKQLLVACARAGVPPETVILELTETAAMGDPVASLKLLTRLRLEGFRVSLDDFGTGYSSMLQLARMPFSEVKVDQSFVTNGRSSDESLIVIRSIIDLGHALGMKCTAEGVEDEPTLEMLRDMDCDFAQGFHIARPMDAKALEAWKYPLAS